MTKEVLKLKFEQGKLTQQELNEFFESNIYIPKVENLLPALFACKHTQNDDSFKIVTITKYTPNDGDYEYHDAKGNSYCTAVFLESIKPSEPVYEWQWVWLSDDINTMPSSYFTNNEIIEKFAVPSRFIKIEETKRVRQ